METAAGFFFLALLLTACFVLVRRAWQLIRRWSSQSRSEPVPPGGAARRTPAHARRHGRAGQSQSNCIDAVRGTRIPQPGDPRAGQPVQERRHQSEPPGGAKRSRPRVGQSQSFEAAIGFAALAASPEIPSGRTDWAVRSLRRCPQELEHFIYRLLASHAEYPVIGPALSQLDEGVSWPELARFVAMRREAGEEITAEVLRRNVARRLAPVVESFLDRFEDELGPEFRTAFDEWRETTVDTGVPAGIRARLGASIRRAACAPRRTPARARRVAPECARANAQAIGAARG